VIVSEGGRAPVSFVRPHRTHPPVEVVKGSEARLENGFCEVRVLTVLRRVLTVLRRVLTVLRRVLTLLRCTSPPPCSRWPRRSPRARAC
jgi:hypothetical protein